jgi:hypothetical protein
MVNNEFTVRLNATFAWLAPEPVPRFSGYKAVNKESEASAQRSVLLSISESKNFIAGNKVISYLYQDPSQRSNIITLVVPGLRGVIWDNRMSVVESERPAIEATLERPPFDFYDIYDYPPVSETARKDDLAQYQLIGKTTPYDVLYITVDDYIAYINNKQPITIAIPNSTLSMELTYEESDFWDQAYDAIVDRI